MARNGIQLECPACQTTYRYLWACSGCRDRWITTLLDDDMYRPSAYRSLALGFAVSEPILEKARQLWRADRRKQ